MEKFTIEIPEFCLVALIGSSSAGKSSFARKHFKPTEILSSDFFRAMICDDENEQSISSDAFELLYTAANMRLSNKRLTVIDATSCEKSARQKLLEIAEQYNVPVAAIVLNLPEELLLQRNKARPDRDIPDSVIRRHFLEVTQSIENIDSEGFSYIYIINSLDQLNSVQIVRIKQ